VHRQRFSLKELSSEPVPSPKKEGLSRVDFACFHNSSVSRCSSAFLAVSSECFDPRLPPSPILPVLLVAHKGTMCASSLSSLESVTYLVGEPLPVSGPCCLRGRSSRSDLTSTEAVSPSPSHERRFLSPHFRAYPSLLHCSHPLSALN